MVELITHTSAELGIPLAAEKHVSPRTKLTFPGIVLDTAEPTISLPLGKLDEILGITRSFRGKSSCTRLELQSLIGSLSFASKCIPAGRLFTRRLIKLLPTRRNSVNNLDDEAQQDRWEECLPKWNGQAPFLDPRWLSPAITHLFTDASATLGFGGYFQHEWFNCRWPDSVLSSNPSIELMELFPILVACAIWGDQFYRKRILFHCDNLGTCQAWQNLRSISSPVLALMRRIVCVAAEKNFVLNVVHIPGLRNTTADSMSRFQMSRFRALDPQANIEGHLIPPELLRPLCSLL